MHPSMGHRVECAQQQQQQQQEQELCVTGSPLPGVHVIATSQEDLCVDVIMGDQQASIHGVVVEPKKEMVSIIEVPQRSSNNDDDDDGDDDDYDNKWALASVKQHNHCVDDDDDDDGCDEYDDFYTAGGFI